MEPKALWEQFTTLPPDAQRQVLDFMAFLRARAASTRLRKTSKAGSLTDEPFVGIWRDRDDLQDSSAWVRSIRVREWVSTRG